MQFLSSTLRVRGLNKGKIAKRGEEEASRKKADWAGYPMRVAIKKKKKIFKKNEKKKGTQRSCRGSLGVTFFFFFLFSLSPQASLVFL